MKTFTDYLFFTTKQKREIVNITHQVEEIVRKSKVKEGMVLVSAMHITASVFINDEESGIKQDFLEWAEQLDFGPWQQVFYGEFDGQRKKRLVVKVMGE